MKRFRRYSSAASRASDAGGSGGLDNPDATVSPVGQPGLPGTGMIEAELVDEDGRKYVGPPCPTCGSPREGSSRFCAACGAPLETRDGPVAVSGESGASQSALPSHTFQCHHCGSEVATSVDQRSYVCPFCDSSYVTEIPLERSGRQRPEFVIGFAVTASEAKESFFRWLRENSWFRPGDLASKAIAERQKGIYLPFWHFAMFAASDWSANIGEYWYRTETYTARDSQGRTVTRTRQVRETEWFPLNGSHGRYYYGFLVPATKGISQQEAAAIQPYRLSAMVRYRPYFLAGWMAEEYSVSMEQAIQQTKSEFRQRQEAEVRGFLPGDTASGVEVRTRFELNGSDLVLLPLHVLSYRYRNRVFRFLVNGQTGKVIGEKPWSGKRITAFVILVVLIIVSVILVSAFLTGR